MEYQPAIHVEDDREKYCIDAPGAGAGRFVHKANDLFSQVAILVCAPTPPHAPFFTSGNVSTLLGYEPKEIVGNASFWMNSVHAEDTPQLLSGLFHLFTRGNHIYDYRFIKKDGTYKRLLAELHLHRRRKKEPIAMMAYLREPVVTDSMLQGAEKPAVLFPGMDAAWMTIDSRRRIREANAGMAEICGRPSSDLVGAPALDLIPPDYAHLASDIFNRIAQHAEAKTHRFWQAIQHQDGSLRFIAAEGTRHRDRSGSPAIMMKCRDISGLVALDAKSRVRCAARLLSALSREDGMPRSTDSQEPLDRLTGRERETLYLTVEGLSSTQIGERLSISPRTVEAHRAHIMNKLGVRSLSQLIRYTVSCITYPEAS